MSPPDRRRGAALSVLASIFAAVFLLAFQHATRAAPRDAAVLAMLACAMAFNGGLAALRGRRDPGTPRVVAGSVLALAALTIGGNVGVAGALERLGPGLTGTLLQTQVFLVALGGWLFLRERITAWLLGGAALAVGGFVVTAAPGLGGAPLDPIGIAFATLASASFGAILLITRAVVDRIDVVIVNAARLVLAVVALALWPGRSPVSFGPDVWMAVVVAAAAGPFASRLCLMRAVEHLSASRVKLITLSSPVFAFALEALVLGSLPSGRELAGAALILAGVVLPVAGEARRGAEAAPHG